MVLVDPLAPFLPEDLQVSGFRPGIHHRFLIGFGAVRPGFDHEELVIGRTGRGPLNSWWQRCPNAAMSHDANVVCPAEGDPHGLFLFQVLNDPLGGVEPGVVDRVCFFVRPPAHVPLKKELHDGAASMGFAGSCLASFLQVGVSLIPGNLADLD